MTGLYAWKKDREYAEILQSIKEQEISWKRIWIIRPQLKSTTMYWL